MMLLAALAVTANAGATEIGTSRAFGLGIQLGDPTSLTGKVYLGGRTNALDFALGTFYDDYGPWDTLWAQVSYHWHIVELTSGNGVAIPFRIGVGGFLSTYHYAWVYDDYAVGVRVPIGLDFDLETAPVQFYVELAPDVVIVPRPGGYGDGGIGFRYYF